MMIFWKNFVIFRKNLACMVDLFRTVVFDPWERPYYISLLLTSLAVVYNLFFVIVRSAFSELEANCPEVWLMMDILADLLYLADMVVQSKKGKAQIFPFLNKFGKSQIKQNCGIYSIYCSM